MNSFGVDDIRYEAVLTGEPYTLGIFASGYEARCSHVARRLPSEMLDDVIVLGFARESDNATRLENDAFFESRWGSVRRMGSGEDGPLLEMLRERLAVSPSRVRILVDYSSMSRLWYTSILNWARLAAPADEVEVDFVYSAARYGPAVGSALLIDEISALPGCEGMGLQRGGGVAVMGLGFHGYATEVVLEQLEPDVVHYFLADPGVDPAYLERVLSRNHAVMSDPKAGQELRLPVSSVEVAYSRLVSLIEPHRGLKNITLVPMGPKPHMLAAVLVAMRFDEVACLRVSGVRERPPKVEPTGSVFVARVTIRREPHVG